MKTSYRETMAVSLMLAIFPVIATADDTKSQQQQEQTTDGTNQVITKEFCKSARETGDHFTCLPTVFALKEYGDERICMEEAVEATIEGKCSPWGTVSKKR